MLESIAAGFIANIGYDVSIAAFKKAYNFVASSRPELESKAIAALENGEVKELERVFKEATGVILAEASKGQLVIDGATLEAINGIKFNHEAGEIHIGSSVISSKILVTGGDAGSTGTTTVGGNTNLKSLGTEIKVGKNCQIVLSGAAKIVQS